jgi:hypothetical protein
MPTRRRSKGEATRPNLSRLVRQLIRDIARRIPELRHARAENILVVAGEARRASRATIRPMRFPNGRRLNAETGVRKPRVTFRGHDILYVMILRPLFFRNSTPEKRVETVVHEIFHVSRAFDGTLDPARRHSALRRTAFEHALRPLVKRYLAVCPADTLAKLSTNGDVRVRQWLEKPPNSYRSGSKGRHRYDDTQTFLGPVRMITKLTRH